MSVLRLGCIADDFTGATDLANNLVRAGMRAVQVNGAPGGDLEDDVDAVVVALKTRTVPSDDAVARSLHALRWLRLQGAGQIYFKYCSTFDSTPQGNIGPVTEALMEALRDRRNANFTIATPAFPDNGRTVFNGHLFVGQVPLNESGMQHHPLTPMTDANLVRVLQAQCTRKVGLVDHRIVASGPDAIRARFDALREQDVGIAIVDAISNDDLIRLGPALADLPLVTAGSGVAIALPANFGLRPSSAASTLPDASGAKAVIAGSCSQATNRQVRAFMEAGGLAFAVDPQEIAEGIDVPARALAWAASRLAKGPVLVCSSADPARVAAVQRQLGAQRAGAFVESALAAIARGFVDLGVRQLVVAGGETAGACVQALGIRRMRIGPQIDPGVPWCYARTDGGIALHLALKSGNFGTDDFFAKSFAMLG
ncbi:MAG TPA: 3-oxo-tetronate kinase [Casimicrobiaceae bacterium]